MVSTIRVVPGGLQETRGPRRGGVLHAMWRQKGLITALFMWFVYAPAVAALFCWLEGWGVWDSFVYAGVLLTTIGYGTTTPATPAGKLWTIAVAVPGIPMMVHALHWIGSLTSGVSRRAIMYYHKVRGDDVQRPSVRSEVAFTFFLIILWYFHCVFVYWTNEDWTFVTSCYFTFTTLSTVGFGDYEPLDSPSSRRKIENFSLYHAWYITLSIFGLAFLSQLFGVVIMWLEHTDAHFSNLSASARRLSSSARRLSLKLTAQRLSLKGFEFKHGSTASLKLDVATVVARRKLLAAAYVESGDDWCEVLRRIDTNNDGRISRDEFTSWCESRLHMHDHGDIDAVYALADRDGSGDLDLDELAWLLDSSQADH